MKRPQGPIHKDDIRPRDVIAYQNKAGLWSIRHIDDNGAPDGTSYVLLSTLGDAPDAPTIVVDDGFIGADPDTGRPSADLHEALAVRVSSPPYADGYLVVSDTPFVVSAADVAAMEWRRAVVLDAQEIQDIAGTHPRHDLTEALKTAWGENND